MRTDRRRDRFVCSGRGGNAGSRFGGLFRGGDGRFAGGRSGNSCGGSRHLSNRGGAHYRDGPGGWKGHRDRSDRLVWNKVSEVTGINIEWEVIDADALATYLAGGDWPDFIHYNLDSSMVNDYGVVGGRFVNYLDYLDLMPNLVQTFEDYPIAKKASIEINGEMYSLPGIEISATTASARPYVRTDVLDAAGLSMPTTVEEFHDALAVLKKRTGKRASSRICQTMNPTGAPCCSLPSAL